MEESKYSTRKSGAEIRLSDIVDKPLKDMAGYYQKQG
jgi:hypothetical protein